jgi:hypothetical protein
MDIRGKFWIQRISAILDHPWQAGDEGRIVYDEENDQVYFGGATEWKKANAPSSIFSVGSEIIFASTPLPAGWNIKLVSVLDTILITDSTEEVGDTGGSWAITGMNGAGNHNHFAPDPTAIPTTEGGRGTSSYYNWVPGNNHIHDIYASGNHSHTFDGSWHPPTKQYGIGVWQG